MWQEQEIEIFAGIKVTKSRELPDYMNSWSNCSCVITRLSDGWMFATCPTFLGSYLEKYERGRGVNKGF